MRTLVVAALAALIVMLAAPASATDMVDVPLDRDINVDDSDSDGWEETDGYVIAGGPCGCACPEVFGGASIEAAGSRADLVVGFVILPVCGVGAWWDVDPADPDPSAPVSATPSMWCNFFPGDRDHDCLHDRLDIIDINWP